MGFHRWVIFSFRYWCEILFHINLTITENFHGVYILFLSSNVSVISLIPFVKEMDVVCFSTLEGGISSSIKFVWLVSSGWWEKGCVGEEGFSEFVWIISSINSVASNLSLKDGIEAVCSPRWQT